MQVIAFSLLLIVAGIGAASINRSDKEMLAILTKNFEGAPTNPKYQIRDYYDYQQIGEYTLELHDIKYSFYPGATFYNVRDGDLSIHFYVTTTGTYKILTKGGSAYSWGRFNSTSAPGVDYDYTIDPNTGKMSVKYDIAVYWQQAVLFDGAVPSGRDFKATIQEYLYGAHFPANFQGIIDDAVNEFNSEPSDIITLG